MNASPVEAATRGPETINLLGACSPALPLASRQRVRGRRHVALVSPGVQTERYHISSPVLSTATVGETCERSAAGREVGKAKGQPGQTVVTRSTPGTF